MDAVEYLKEFGRMCAFQKKHGSCKECPIETQIQDSNELKFCKIGVFNYPDSTVAIVEKWSFDHPRETYRTHFLKAFPNAISFGRVCKNAVYNMNQGRCNAGFDAKCSDCWDEPYEP